VERKEISALFATALADIPFDPRFAYLAPGERFLYFQQQEDPKRRLVLIKGLFSYAFRRLRPRARERSCPAR
jgi:hypothetical protein